MFRGTKMSRVVAKAQDLSINVRRTMKLMRHYLRLTTRISQHHLASLLNNQPDLQFPQAIDRLVPCLCLQEILFPFTEASPKSWFHLVYI